MASEQHVAHNQIPAPSQERGELLHQDTLTLWRLRARLEYWIVNHIAYQTIEIVAYRPDLDKEDRIYLSRELLLGKMDPEEMRIAVLEQKEECQRQKKEFRLEEFISSLQKEHIVNFVKKRINIPSNLAEGQFRAELKVNFGDKTRSCLPILAAGDLSPTTKSHTFVDSAVVLDVVMDAKPASLPPYEVKFCRPIASEEVLSALDKFSSEQHALAKFTHVVSKIITATTASHSSDPHPLPSASQDTSDVQTGSSPGRRARARGSLLLRSIDDNFVMECTNFWATNNNPVVSEIITKLSSAKGAGGIKLEPIAASAGKGTADSDPRKAPSPSNQPPSIRPPPTGTAPSTQSHDNHIPGLKLLKKVGSFKFSNDPEPLYAAEMVKNAMVGAESNTLHAESATKQLDRKASVSTSKFHYLSDTKSSKKKMARSGARSQSVVRRKQQASAAVASKPPPPAQTAQTCGTNGQDDVAALQLPDVDGADRTAPGPEEAVVAAEKPKSPGAKEKVMTRMKSRMLNSLAGTPGAVAPQPASDAAAPGEMRRSNSLQKKFGSISSIAQEFSLEEVGVSCGARSGSGTVR